MENEIWKDIPGYEGLYQASNLGRIRSLKYDKVRIMKPQRSGKGYYKVILCLNSVFSHARIHRLVWSAFNGPIPEGLEINHKDEDKANNALLNLELVTRKENVTYGTAIARASKKRSKQVIQFDKNGNFIKEWPSSNEIQRQLGYSASNIRNCCGNFIHSAYGFIWKYKKENPEIL